MPKDIFTKELKLFLNKNDYGWKFLEYYRNIKFLNESFGQAYLDFIKKDKEQHLHTT